MGIQKKIWCVWCDGVRFVRCEGVYNVRVCVVCDGTYIVCVV